MDDETSPDESVDNDASPEPGPQPESGDTAAQEPSAFTRVCRRCSAQATTSADRCPACGARYARRRPSKKVAVSATAVLAVAFAGTAVWAVLDKRADDKRERERVARVEAQRKAAAEQAKQEAEEAADAEAAAAKFLKTMRESYVLELRKSITKHAQKAYDDGLLDGRATGSSCDNVDGNESDEDAESAEYECMAITKHNGDGTVSGFSYTGRINYDDGTMTWQIGD